MSDKPKTPFIGTTRTEGWILAGVAGAFALLVGALLGEDRGWIGGDAAGALAGLIIVSWPLRRERWFWVAMAALTGVNAFAVARFDWSFIHSWSGHAVALLMVLDLLAMTAIVYCLYCLIYGAPSEAVAALPDEGPSYSERDLNL
jgi:hypothetical protein